MKLAEGLIIFTSPKISKLVQPSHKQNKIYSEDEKQRYLHDAEGEARFLDWQKPSWNEGGNVHNWHNYATPALEIIWETFTDQQKKVIAAVLDNNASNEIWE